MSMPAAAAAALADFPPPNSDAAEMGGAASRMQLRKSAREAMEGPGRSGCFLFLSSPPLSFPLARRRRPSLAGLGAVVLRLLREVVVLVGFFLGLALLWLREIPSPNAQSERWLAGRGFARAGAAL